jgi:membrane protease YdiL (CAAX protease family)
MAATRQPAGRRRRFVVAVVAVVAILAGANVAIRFGPVGTGVVAGPVVALVLVILARRAGLSWEDLGLSRRGLRKGAAWAVAAVLAVAGVYLGVLTLPWVRATVLDLSGFLEIAGQVDRESALVRGLLVIPLGTILLEEIAFRGVLFGLLRNRRRAAWAFGFSSSLFGLWHVLPLLPSSTFPTVASVVGVTALFGLLLCELRRRSGSLLAAAAGHWAANGFGVLLAALLWSWH